VRRYGWRIAAHTHARRWLEDATLQRSERPLPNFDTLMAGSITVDQPLNEGDEIDLGGCRVRALYTPGHSRGSQSLVVEPDDVIITGDALISAVAAPFYDDPLAVRASVETLRRELAGGARLLSSHATTPSFVTVQTLDETLALVERMAIAVRQAQSELDDGDEDALVRRSLDLGGWPGQAVTPLTRITVRSHLVGS
jgi:glyoxylase-like metal-dependent hydrolase (beta-lactamase superfamily II)